MTPLTNSLPKPVRAGIAGLGMCVPQRVLTNEELSRMVETNSEWIVSRTGIHERRIADSATNTSDLAFEAAKLALEHASLEPGEIDLVLCATTSGDYLWPSTACLVQHRLGATRAAAFDLGAACSGFCYGLATASSFIESGMMKNILLIGADTLSKQVDWQDRSTCILFGDGAGAVVLTACSPDEGVLASILGADGSGSEAVWLPAGGTKIPITQEVIDQKLNCLRMKGQEVYRFTMNVIPELVIKVLKQVCLTPNDIDLLVLHQANARIISSIGDRLGIPPERNYINVHKYGNTSAATVPMALVEAQQEGRLKRGDIVVTVGYGAGLTWAANVIRWNR